jgi:NAD(P)-dependent dehydrogenase (short-subunit alcohol dehydrogenase family)
MAEPHVAVVTGATRGIGRVVTDRLVSLGYRVAAVATDATRLAEVTGVLPLALDVADASAVEEAAVRIAAELGPIDLLVNNAGVSGGGRSWEVPVAEWWRVFEVNVLGTYAWCHAVVPSMIGRGSGRIVNVASNAAFYAVGPGDPISAAYQASKAAVVRFTEAIAGELGQSGVRVFVVSPGTVRTDMTAGLFADHLDDEELWTPPERVAHLIEALGSGRLDALSGRYLHARNDDWESYGDRADEILAQDLNVVRLRTLD